MLAAYALVLPLRRHGLAFLFAVGLPLVFISIVGSDLGRWIKMAVFDAWLLAAFHQARDTQTLSPGRGSMVAGCVVLLGLLAAGPATYDYPGWRLHALLVRLGFPDPGSNQDWMARCDPAWRSFVHPPD